MKNKHYFSGMLLGLFLFATGCSHPPDKTIGSVLDRKMPNKNSGNPTNIWNPNTGNLDEPASEDSSFVSLDHEVKSFYTMLRQKDWKSAYARRWKTFKEDMPETTCLDPVKQEGTNWELANYEILSAQMYNDNAAILICKFVELPGPLTSYAAVNWRKEKDGVWRCDSAGPARLTIFKSLRYEMKNDD